MIKQITKQFILMYSYRLLSVFPTKKKSHFRSRSDSIKEALFFGLVQKSAKSEPTSQKKNKKEKVIDSFIFLDNTINEIERNLPSSRPVSTKDFPSFSIIINTCNRLESLRETLSSISYLRYPGEYEVIVVNGPSTDGTNEYLDSLRDFIKIGHCPDANLSKSRNIGVAMSKGDIVAFIDDDAIPEPDWLYDLSLCYVDATIGCAGGRVFNSTGHEFQEQYIYSNRVGRSCNSTKKIDASYFPGSFSFPLCIGTNCSFRRKVLISVGGFDEEIEYFLDENDVITRLIDAGYKVAQTSNAYVHHKFAKSYLRDDRRKIKNVYPIIKNKLYYSLQHISFEISYDYIINDAKQLISELEPQFSSDDKNEFNNQVLAAFRRILFLLKNHVPKKLISNDLLNEFSNISFKKANSLTKNDALNIVLIDRYYLKPGGLTTTFNSLARGLIDEGHIVHIICESFGECSKVYFDSGVWIHSLKMSCSYGDKTINGCKVPNHIWSWSCTAYKECEIIDSHHKVDIVESAIWDVEGIAFIVKKRWTTITFLVTPLSVWVDNNKFMLSKRWWVKDFYLPMLEAEKFVMTNSDGLKADSSAIILTLEQKYNIKLDRSITKVVSLGLNPIRYTPESYDDDNIHILFLGRLEKRKGIDTLLSSIPIILNKFDNVVFEIVGNDEIIENDLNYKKEFIKKYSSIDKIISRVRFHGQVSDSDRVKFYNKCDIFVAPSRYESFGQIFLEAMMFAKPVIGCNVGGMPDIIIHGKTGYMISPDDVEELSECLSKLIIDKKLRTDFGNNGYNRFINHFTADRMADNSISFYNDIKSKK